MHACMTKVGPPAFQKMIKRFPLCPHLDLSSTCHAINAGTGKMAYQQSGWDTNVLLVWRHQIHGLGCLLNLKTWAYIGTINQLRYPMQPNLSMLLPFTWLNHNTFVCCMVAMGGDKAWAHSRSVRACNTHDCMTLVPMLPTWHFAQQTFPTNNIHSPV
jgi:hypothetical protein